MLKKRIIACLDIKDGRTVKGINFKGMKDAGDPVELASQYAEQGVDELIFLDISATKEKRNALPEQVANIARRINIPFTVGGGIGSSEDVKRLLDSGADKVSINSAAFKNPLLIQELAATYGSQCIVVAIDVKMEKGEWYVYLNGGTLKTHMKVAEWAELAESFGAGELLLTSMDADGTKQGFDIRLTKHISDLVNIPVIASGGAGSMRHFAEVFNEGKADAALAASIFHFGEIRIKDLKTFLTDENIAIRN